MFCNANATLHSNNTAYTFPFVYVFDKVFSELSTSGLKVKTQKVIYIPQDKNSVDLLSLNVAVGKDYFNINNGIKKYTISSFVDAMYGTANMKHMEFILE